MNKKEALQILAILKAAYPNSYNNMTKEEATGTVAVWCMQFTNLPAEIVMMAVHKLIATSKFPPTISEVKRKIESIHWDAYEHISRITYKELLPEETLKMYERIYEITQPYRMANLAEPSILDLMQTNQRLQIGSGDV